MSHLGKLLVVDDEADICDFVCYVAENIGFDTHSITNADEFESIDIRELSIIVLDLSMPGVDGIELIRSLAEKKYTASIILMSGMDSSVLHSARNIAEGRGLKVIKCLQKPVSIKVLEAALLESSNNVGVKDLKSQLVLPTKEELQQAIKQLHIVPFFQPKVDLQTREVIGVEALARWIHPEKGIIPPDHFIDLAEQNNLIHDLTFLMLDKSLKQCSQWLHSGKRLYVAINMSPQVLTDLNFPDWLFSEIRKYELDPSQVIIEVTESCLFNELNDSLDILTRLRLKGFKLSIDDYGTGYSSMKQLKSVPFTELKIDQSFVKEADTDSEARIICESTVELGHKLNMSVIAEGIETERVFNLLKELGCNEGQGYFIAKPLAADDFDQWIGKDWKCKASV